MGLVCFLHLGIEGGTLSGFSEWLMKISGSLAGLKKNSLACLGQVLLLFPLSNENDFHTESFPPPLLRYPLLDHDFTHFFEPED